MRFWQDFFLSPLVLHFLMKGTLLLQMKAGKSSHFDQGEWELRRSTLFWHLTPLNEGLSLLLSLRSPSLAAGKLEMSFEFESLIIIPKWEWNMLLMSSFWKSTNNFKITFNVLCNLLPFRCLPNLFSSLAEVDNLTPRTNPNRCQADGFYFLI